MAAKGELVKQNFRIEVPTVGAERKAFRAGFLAVGASNKVNSIRL